MSKDYVKTAVRIVQELGGSKAARRLLILAPLKRGVENREDVLRAVSEERGEGLASVRKEFAGWVPGAVFRAEDSVGTHLLEADLVLVSPDGRTFELAGNTLTIRPKQIRWAEARWLTPDLDSSHSLAEWKNYVFRALGM